MCECTSAPDTSAARPGFTRRQLLVGGAAAGGALALSALPVGAETGTASSDDPVTTTTQPAITEPAHPSDDAQSRAADPFYTLLSESPDRQIMFPIFPNSATSWNRNQDTYGNPRPTHQGEDLMAPKMTKLLAVKSGTVVELRHRPQVGNKGGNSLYIRGDDGWFYCYLHINNDSGLREIPSEDDESNKVVRAWGPGLQRFATSPTTMDEVAARGYRVREGEVIAYCGDSGNAEDAGSHLHFEIRKPASGSFATDNARLWKSSSVNPRESLRNAKPARIAPSVPPETFTPWAASAPLVDRQYSDFLGRTAGTARSHWMSELDGGRRSPQWFMQYMLESEECDTKTQAVGRLYEAFFLRRPDFAGFDFWTKRRRGGQALTSIADGFARSPEFQERYGTLSNEQFVDRIYLNVLGRPADAEGKAFWTQKLDGGRSRGTVMVQFSESPENKAKQRWRMHTIAAYGCMLKKMPTEDEIKVWTTLFANGQNSTQDMVNMIRNGDEYQRVTGNA